MGDSCKTSVWGERSSSLSIEAGPKTLDVKATGTVKKVSLEQYWENNHPSVGSDGYIISAGCRTVWTERCESKVTEWKYEDADIDKAAISLLSEIEAKKANLKDAGKINFTSKIDSKTKIFTRYLTLPISVWCVTNDYVRYQWDKAPKKVVTPEQPDPSEEWEGPKPGDTSSIGPKTEIFCTCGNGKADTSGGSCGKGARDMGRRPTGEVKYKDCKVSVSIKWNYTKITAA